MTSIKPFRCAECGREVSVARPRTDVLWDMGDGVLLAIPSAIEVPSCECGEYYVSGDLAKQIDEALQPQFLAARARAASKVIDHILSISKITQRQLEGICAVSQGYLSKVRSGDRTVSTTLVRFLEALAACPAEVQRHIERRAWTEEHAFAQLLLSRPSSTMTSLHGRSGVWSKPSRAAAWAESKVPSANDNALSQGPRSEQVVA